MTINDHDQFTGLNAVHVAASEGNVKKLVELMDDGAELDIPALGENAGKTAAMIAAGAGHVDVLKAMQRGPSMLDLKAADGGTPAMSAAVHGYKEVLDYLISKKVDLNAQDEDGWTALHFAVMANAASSVKALLAAGAKTDIKNSDGDTAEMLAQGSKAGIKKLFGKGGSSQRLDGVKEGKKGCVVM